MSIQQAQHVTICSTGGTIHPFSNFTELHALILATLSSCTLANSVVTCLRAQAALVPSASEQLIILVGILHQDRVDIEL